MKHLKWIWNYNESVYSIKTYDKTTYTYISYSSKMSLSWDGQNDTASEDNDWITILTYEE